VQQQIGGSHGASFIIVVLDNDIMLENSDAMATLQLTPTTLALHLTLGEKLAGLLRDLDVPRTSVRAVEVVHEPLRELRGLRAPGLAVPGIRKVGTWRRPGERTLVSVRKGQPAIRIRLEGARYDTLLVGTDDAPAIARSLTPAT
jgi:hypothetical protein